MNFSTCTAPELVSLLCQWLPAESETSFSEWDRRGKQLAEVTVNALVWLRDRRGRALTPRAVEVAAHLDGLVALLDDPDLADPSALEVTVPIRAYLAEVLHFTACDAPSDAAREQVGYTAMRMCVHRTMFALERGESAQGPSDVPDGVS